MNINQTTGLRILSFALLLFLLPGCQVIEPEKKENLEFIVVAKECLPVELQEIIQTKKEDVFKITYIDGEHLYIAEGYGQQDSGGYSIQVKELYRSDNAIYMDSCLLGPKPRTRQERDEQENTPSYPYIVLRTREIGLPVVFQ